jgi:putative ABC transport system ATP-binding protein
MIRLSNISKIYGDKNNENSIRALFGINLDIKDGEFIAITGKSGCGKTTLLNIIGSIDSPTSGEVIFDDVNLNDYNSKQIAKFRNRNIGFIFQSYFLERGRRESPPYPPPMMP